MATNLKKLITDKSNKIILFLVILVVFGVLLNRLEQKAVDQSTLPEKIELSKGFQRWITNLKNKGLEVEADDFELLEENEIYNTKWTTVISLDREGVEDEYKNLLEEHREYENVAFSPSDRLFLDYRFIQRGEYPAGWVRLYGQKDNNVIDSRVAECKNGSNCVFDRGYFISNDLFVVSEFSLFEQDYQDNFSSNVCEVDNDCTYTIKVHVIDLVANQRLIYESDPFEINLENFKENF